MYPGRGRPPSNYRGRGGRSRGNDSSRIFAQHGNKKLVQMDKNIQVDESHPAYEKIKQIIAESSTETTSSPGQSYASTLESTDEIEQYQRSNYEEEICLLENEDKQWMEDPWYLKQRYLDHYMAPIPTGKDRIYYENILRLTESCEIEHFKANNSLQIIYSKIYIKKVITIKEWGISTHSNREFARGSNMIQFNYWDYINAFNKAFWYENEKRKHSWWIKFNPEIFAKKRFPNWIFRWWQNHGATMEILPDPYKGLFTEWVNNTPYISAYSKEYIAETAMLFFFMQFGIPWIWKWNLSAGLNQSNIPCLKRKFYSKFWQKLLKIDKETNVAYGQELEEIIQKTINEDKANKVQKEEHTPFSEVFQKIKRTQPLQNTEEMVAAYIEEMKRGFMQHFKEDVETTSNTSQSTDENTFTCLAGESQDPNEMEIPTEEFWESLKETMMEKARRKKEKEKVKD